MASPAASPATNQTFAPIPRSCSSAGINTSPTPPAAVSSLTQFGNDLCGGGYWRGLSQYGVGAPTLQGQVVINMKNYPTPNSQNPGQSFSESQMQNQLISWLNAGVVTPKPSGNEENLVYLILAPSDTTLSLNNQLLPQPRAIGSLLQSRRPRLVQRQRLRNRRHLRSHQNPRLLHYRPLQRLERRNQLVERRRQMYHRPHWSALVSGSQ
jgi:hypothetical protein